MFDPGKTGDATLATGMRALLSDGGTSSYAVDCLRRQLGQPAARSSCESPWSASLNTSLRISGAQVLHNERMDLTINLANPLGGLDQLLHGSNGLHGWGTMPAPNPVLLDVRGFDPVANRYNFALNPRFGATNSSSNVIRAPFRLTVDVSVDIGPSQVEQQFDRWLRPGRAGREGTRVTKQDLTRRFQRTVPDPYAEVLQEVDSLLLTPKQVAALQDADMRYRTQVDSIWVQVSQYLASLPDSYGASEAFHQADDATDDAWELTRLNVRHDFQEILTPSQLTTLSSLSRQLFNATGRVHIRVFPRGS